MLRRSFVCRTTVLALSLVGIASVKGQEPNRPDLTGKWQLRTHDDRGKEEIFTLDLTESGSLLVGAVTPQNGGAMTISDGYYVGAAIKISASGRQHLFSSSIEISGRFEGDKMILNVKRGSGVTTLAVAERMPAGPRR
jgi:hypothetical protein